MKRLVLITICTMPFLVYSQSKFEDFKSTFEIKSDKESVVIPFEMHGKNIRMKATINGFECNVLLDNGSLWDDLLFFGSAKVDAMNLNLQGTVTLGDTSALNPLISDTAKEIDLEFDGITFTNQNAVVMRYIKGLPNPWEGADLQVSSAFFKNFIVEINFDGSYIRLTKPSSFTYNGEGEVFTMSEGIYDSRITKAEVVMNSGEEVGLEFLLDLGGLYDLYLPIGNNKGIKLPSDAKHASLGVGSFGASEGYLGTVKELKLGSFVLKNLNTTFVEAKSEDVYGNTMFGLPLFKRFNITFDYFNNRMIMEPSEYFDK